MKHATLNLMEILIVSVCLLMAQAMPAFAYNSDTGLTGSTTPSFSGLNDVDGKHGKIRAKMASVQIPFVANEGQMDENVKFYAKTFGGTVFVTRDGKIVYNLPFYENEEKEGEFPGGQGKGKTKKITKGVALLEELVKGTIKDVRGEGATATKVNYLRGRDKSKWKSNVSTYEMVNLGEVYEGVDLKLRVYGNNVEKLFFVQPGADANNIRIQIEGAESVKTNKAGRLEIETELGKVSFTAPIAYQETDGERRNIKVDYVVESNIYGFELGKYDRKKEVVIDPLLASTLLGGDSFSLDQSIAIDQNGNVYISGDINSIEFPTTSGSYNEIFNGGKDLLVSKLNGDLTELLASTFLGGSGDEYGTSLAIDQSGAVYVAGKTFSTDFPTTTGAYDENFNSTHDAFVSKLNGDLTTLLASTYIGGSESDTILSLALDQNGNVYLAGDTHSIDFPATPGDFYNGSRGNTDIFIVKLDGDLTTLLASTLLASSSSIYSIAIDDIGNVYVGGSTIRVLFPTTQGAYCENYIGADDIFISKLNNDLSSLLASTRLGGASSDRAESITLDQTGNVYLTGVTSSTDFPTTLGAYDEVSSDGSDAFVSKLNSNLTTLLFSTYLGGSESDIAYSLMLDQSGSVYVTGFTLSTDFPITSGAYCENKGEYEDVFITKLDGDLSTLSASTFLGESGKEYGHSLGLDQVGNVYVVGNTSSNYFPTSPTAFSQGNGDYYDFFISKLDSNLSAGDFPTSIVVKEPDGADDSVNLYNTLTYTINWLDYAGGDGTISFYYDTDDSGENGALIVSGISENNVSDQYVWDVSALAEGDYYVYAVLNDGVNPVVVDYSTGPVTLIDNEEPTIQVLEPNGDDTADTAFTITWTDQDADDSAIISLYYDTDGGGEDGTLIENSISEDGVSDQYAWDVSALANGDYYVYAVIDDGVNPDVVDYSNGPITVFHPSPTELTTSSTTGGSVSVPGEGTFSNSAGSTVNLVATPASGYYFVNWTGNVSTVANDNSASTTITMDDNYSITANFALNNTPTIQILQPDGVADAANLAFTISWSDSDTDNDAAVSLYYDMDNTGQDGTLIVDAISENDGADQYSWDVSALPDGDYYVYGVIDDGVNSVVVDYSAGAVSVSHASHFVTVWSGNNSNDRLGLWTWSAAIDGVDLTTNDEIGVFDGADCVGVGVVSGPISTGNPLIILSSKDDGDGKGYTEGNAITFKIWDASEQEEITVVTPQYYDIVSGDPISPPVFATDEDYALELAGLIIESHTIPLTAGWNIFSTYTTPVDPDMMSVVQPLIDAGVLLKVYDEIGNTILNNGGVWNNTIGNVDPRKGYKIKVTADVDLEIQGGPNALPMDIDLAVGWNYMAWPSTATQDAMTVLQPLINADALEKVIDEFGNALLVVLGAWTNKIGAFEPGEGYKIKLKQPATLTIDAPPPGRRARRVDQNDPGSMDAAPAPSHFQPAWSGKPNQRMNLWVAKAMTFKLLPGDEIGVFDGERCVGVGVVEEHISRRNILTITTSRDDGAGEGFVDGRPISFKVWSARKEREIADVEPVYFDISSGVPVDAPGFEGNGDYGVMLWILE